MTTQNPWDAGKAEIRDTFIEIRTHPKKHEQHQTNNLTLDLKQLQKGQQQPNKTKDGKRKKNHNIRAGINETVSKINKTKSWFFKKMSKIDKPIDRFIGRGGRRLTSIKLEIKEEKLHQTMQKYKRP